MAGQNLTMCDHDHSGEDHMQLIKAVVKSRLDCVTTLIQKGADVKIPQEYFKMAVLFAVENWEENFLANDDKWKVDFEILVSLLIDSCPDVYDHEEERMLCISMLNISALNGNLGSLRKVLNAGVDPDIVQHSGQATALMKASGNGFLDCVNALLQAGADVNKQYSGMSILMYTACRGWHGCLTALLQAGADVNFADSSGDTALACAVIADEYSRMWLTKPEMKDRDSQLITDRLPLTNSGEGLCVKVLIEGGANVNMQDENGDTALMLAARNNEVACVTYILDAGAQVNLLNHYGQTAITMASKKGHIECVKKLVEAGADVNRLHPIKWPGEKCCKTALMFAAKGGYTDCLKAILHQGADVNTLENKKVLLRERKRHTACRVTK